jgi:hypothetical protein
MALIQGITRELSQGERVYRLMASKNKFNVIKQGLIKGEISPHLQLCDEEGKVYGFLNAAARFGAIGLIRYLTLTCDIEPNQPNNQVCTCTPLLSAISAPCEDAALFLLNEVPGVDINVRTEGGVTPLIVASELGLLKTVKTLVARGADKDINAVWDGEGDEADWWPPLHTSIDCKRKDVALYLVNDVPGVDVNLRLANGTTPLYLAVKAGTLPVVQALVNKGADVNALSSDDNDENVQVHPLHAAIARKREAVALYLIKEVPRVNLYAWTAAGVPTRTLALQQGMWRVVQALDAKIEQGMRRVVQALDARFGRSDAETAAERSAQALLAEEEAEKAQLTDPRKTKSARKKQRRKEKAASRLLAAAGGGGGNTNQVAGESRVADLVTQAEALTLVPEQAREPNSPPPQQQHEEEVQQQCDIPKPVNSAVSDELEDDTPDHLKCPLTLCLMEDPVILVADGCTYERIAIEGHLSYRRQRKNGQNDA